MIISKRKAAEVLHWAARQTDVDPQWVNKVELLSKLCDEGVSKTHIAFLGTSMLAKAVEPRADLMAIKPKLAPKNLRAYSARSLCHGVLVPLSAELDFDIGVTGREPLNNQPYFRMTYLGDDTPVHAGGRQAFDFMLDLVRELDAGDVDQAKRSLAAYVAVRRRYMPQYSNFGEANLSVAGLVAAAKEFVAELSEGGRRAQAVAAGLIDVFAGSARVLSGRINDPSRKFPGDVCVVSESEEWEKSFEVRDKPVSQSDVILFARKCAALGVREAAVVMASPLQELLNPGDWAEEHRMGLTLFYGWHELATQCFFWSGVPSPDAAKAAAQRIYERLKEVEVQAASVEMWVRLTSQDGKGHSSVS